MRAAPQAKLIPVLLLAYSGCGTINDSKIHIDRSFISSGTSGKAHGEGPQRKMTEFLTTLDKETPIVVTIGNFDGMHLGHQHLLAAVRTMAQRLHCTPAIITFQPHTLMVIRPNADIRYLTTLEEKLALAKAWGGIDASIVIRFTPAVAALSAQDFMDRLRERFTIRGIVVGEDFSLGHNRTGNITFLKDYGQQHDMQIEAVSLATEAEQRISSTRIRTLISEGRITEANALLGHPILLEGRVTHGDQRGRQIGFPTANIGPDTHKLLPADGVYAVFVTVHTSERDNAVYMTDKGQLSDSHDLSIVYNGVVNIGLRPTFDGTQRLVEVHLLDVTDVDLYGKYLHVIFVERLRGEQKFSGVQALKQQISLDVQKAHQILISRRVSH